MDPSQSFESFYAGNRDDLFRVVLFIVGDRQKAEDCVAEAFVRACERWPKLRSHPNPAGWVVKTALNVQRSSWRRLRREVLGGPQAEVAVTDEQNYSELVSVIAQLPQRQREVLALRIFLDLSVEDTAQILGISQGSVKTHHHRALESLRTIEGLGDEGRDV